MYQSTNWVIINLDIIDKLSEEKGDICRFCFALDQGCTDPGPDIN